MTVLPTGQYQAITLHTTVSSAGDKWNDSPPLQRLRLSR